MSKIKAAIDFDHYTGPALAPVAQNIHDKMLLNAATFPTPPISMAALQTKIDTFERTLAAKSSRAMADFLAFNAARTDLEAALSTLGNYVNVVAQGNAVTVGLSGFPSYDTTKTVNPAPPAAPENLFLRHGDLSTTIVARYRPDRSPSMNEAQTCTGDPTVEANWHPAGVFSGGKATLTGLTPGTTVWARFRTIGTKGVMGAWSDPAKIMVV
jgi:hypothetical protein